jgi:hypothetical protein
MRCLAQDQELQPRSNALNSLPQHSASSWEMHANIDTQHQSHTHEATSRQQLYGDVLLVIILLSLLS